jgi:two-component system, response regulator
MENLNLVDILIVEDNSSDADLAVRALRKHDITNPVHVVEDGAEALDFIFCRGAYTSRDVLCVPKVIFLDLKMPKVNGLEVLKTVKSDERTHAIPIVILTSSKEDQDIKTAYALGANSYVVKPVDFVAFSYAIGSAGLYWLRVNNPPI